jgi:hypothetical protein
MNPYKPTSNDLRTYYDNNTQYPKSDEDSDGVGDNCEPEGYGCCDNCPEDVNPLQENTDEDDFGAACDCDDNDPKIYPGAEELCDGKDNQCPGDIGYGVVDEGCAPPQPGPITLASGLSSPTYIAIDQNSVYWTDTWVSIKKIPLNGGDFTVLKEGSSSYSSIRNIAVDDFSVYTV